MRTFFSQLTGYKLVPSNLFSRSRCRLSGKEISEAFENQLIHNEKYLQQRGSCDFCENFLLADNSRFAVQY